MGISLDAIGIVARDISASLAFYRTIGLTLDEPAPGEDHVETTLPNGLRLMWDLLELVKQLDPHWVEPVGTRLALAFLCGDAAEVDAVYSRVVAAGYVGKTPPFDAFWGQRYATVMDPDGNAIDLFAPLT